jgi:hypothetical protein
MSLLSFVPAVSTLLAPLAPNDGGVAAAHITWTPNAPRLELFEPQGNRPFVFVVGAPSALGAPFPLPNVAGLLVDPLQSFLIGGLTSPTGRATAQFAGAQLPGSTLELVAQAVVANEQGLWQATPHVARSFAPFGVGASTLAPAPLGVLPLNAAPLFRPKAVDLGGDGRTDVVGVSSAGLVHWRGTSDGRLEVGPYPLDVVITSVSDVAFGDVDGDGDQDAFVGTSRTNGTPGLDHLAINDGSGRLVATSILSSRVSVSDADFGDVDGDGDLDLVIARSVDAHMPGQIAAPLQLLRNDGSGSFTRDSAFESAPWNNRLGANEIEFGDIDQDGDLDLVVARADPFGLATGSLGAENLVLVNNGSGRFADESARRLSPRFKDNTYGLALVDIDGDQDLDIVCANGVGFSGAANSGDVYVNQGGAQNGIAGHFVEDATSALETVIPGSQLRLSIDAFDADADGDADLFLGVHDLPGGSIQGLYVNLGGAQGGALGTFELRRDAEAGDFVSLGTLTLDVDQDGDTDLLQSMGGSLNGVPGSVGVRLLLSTRF